MKTKQNKSPFDLNILLLLLFAVFASNSSGAEDFDALYLNDGSVLKGTILRDNSGNFLVYTPSGDLTVESSRVIYSASREKTPPAIQETHIFIGGTTETLTIIEQDVPPKPRNDNEDAKSFHFLVPGTVASILDADGEEIIFRSREAGDNSIVTILYSDLAAETKRLQIALWRFDLLTAAENGRVKFEQKYAPDHEGLARVIVKYPKEWNIAEIAPAPAERHNGLIVWRTMLRRQQNFIPKIVFEKSRGI